MTADFREVDRLAQVICETRNGPGSWDTPHRKRAVYRAEAQRILGDDLAARIEKDPSLAAKAIRFFGVTRLAA